MSIPCLRAPRGQRPQVGDRSQVGVDRVVAAAGVTDRPRRPGIAGRGGERVVGALAVGESDRVDRGQVDDVEAELGQPRQLLPDALQPAPRARKQLVPSAEPGSHAVDLDRQRLARGGRDRGDPASPRRRPAAPRPARCRAWRSRDLGILQFACACSISARCRPSASRGLRTGAAPRPRKARPRDPSGAAATLRRSSSRQVPNTSVQASTVYCQRPGRSTSKCPAQRTPPRWASIR